MPWAAGHGRQSRPGLLRNLAAVVVAIGPTGTSRVRRAGRVNNQHARDARSRDTLASRSQHLASSRASVRATNSLLLLPSRARLSRHHAVLVAGGAGQASRRRQPIAARTATGFKTQVTSACTSLRDARAALLPGPARLGRQCVDWRRCSSQPGEHAGRSVARFVCPRGRMAEVCCSPTTSAVSAVTRSRCRLAGKASDSCAR